MRTFMGAFAAVLLSLSLMAAPADAKGTSGRTSSGGTHSSGSSSNRTASNNLSSSQNKTVTPPKATPPPTVNKTVTPPKNSGGVVSSSNKTATSGRTVTKPTKAANASYFSASSNSTVKSKSGNRVTSYDYTDPVTHNHTTYVYHPPSYYNSPAGGAFLAGLGAGLLIDRFYGPNYYNASSPLYQQPTPPGYYISNGGLVAYHHRSLAMLVFEWFMLILFMAVVIGLLIWGWKAYRNSKKDDNGPSSFASGF